jgi:hypothetical protein
MIFEMKTTIKNETIEKYINKLEIYSSSKNKNQVKFHLKEKNGISS